MLFEEAVMLAESIRKLPQWKFTGLQNESGETHSVLATHRVTNIPYIFETREDWEKISEFVQARVMELEK